MEIGYTAGSRSWPHIDWVRNIKHKLSDNAISDLIYCSGAVFALAWNVFRMQLLPTVVDSFNEYFIDLGIIQMDPLGQNTDITTGEYTILDNGKNPTTFYDVELATPLGFFGANDT